MRRLLSQLFFLCYNKMKKITVVQDEKNYGSTNFPFYYQFYYLRRPSYAMLCRIMDDSAKIPLIGEIAVNRRFTA